MNVDSRQSIQKEATFFLSFGFLNTAFTIIIYQVLLLTLSPTWSYAISWLTGFLCVIGFYPRLVFNQKQSGWRAQFIVAIIYIINFALGTSLLHWLTQISDMPRLSVFVVIAMTSLASFLAMRFFLNTNRSGR